MIPRRVVTALLAATLVASCAHHTHVGPPHAPITAVAVLPIYDPAERSAVSGVFTFHSWIADTRAAVPATLANAVRDALIAEGVAATVTSGTAPKSVAEARETVTRDHLDTPALYISLGKWEASDADHPQYVEVALDASLIDAPNGRLLWTTRWQPAPVATRNATSLAAAYQAAARQVAGELVSGWHHVPPGTKAPG